MFRIGLLTIAAILLVQTSAFAETPACTKNREAIANIDKAIGKIDNSQVLKQLGPDLLGVLDQLIDGLNGTKGDLGKITGSVDQAKKKLGDITKKLKDSKVTIPPAWSKLSNAVDSMAKGIESGVKKYQGSAAGQTASGLAKAQDYIGKAVGQLQNVRNQIADMQAVENAENGTAADQVRALKVVIDKTKSLSGADKVPGVSQFLDAYSTAVGGIANNVGSIESSMNSHIQMANEALKGTDFEGGDIYVHTKTPAERQAAALDALRQQKAKLQAQRADLGCDQPPPPPKLCEQVLGSNGNSANYVHNLVNGMSKVKQLRSDVATYDALAQNAWYEAMQNALQRPHGKPGESQASFNARTAVWQQKQDRLNHEYGVQAAARKAAQDKLDAEIGYGVAQEASAKNWSAADEKTYDECFPEEGAYRRAAKAKGGGHASSVTGPSKPKKMCSSGGGLAGAVNNVACQIGQ